MGSLDEAVALEAGGPGRWQAFADPDHESLNGMFGGWTSAVSLAAVMASADGALRPSALTINYLAAVAPEARPIIHVEHLGGSRFMDGTRAFAQHQEQGLHQFVVFSDGGHQHVARNLQQQGIAVRPAVIDRAFAVDERYEALQLSGFEVPPNIMLAVGIVHPDFEAA